MSQWILLTSQQGEELSALARSRYRDPGLPDDEKSRLRGFLEQLGGTPEFILLDNSIKGDDFHPRFFCTKCGMIDNEVSTRWGRPVCPLHRPLDPQEELFQNLGRALGIALRYVDAAVDMNALPPGFVDEDDVKFLREIRRESQ